MNKQQVKIVVMTGNLIDCSAEEYPDIRRYLQEFAGESVDTGQIIYTQIALNEVARLDKKFAAVEHTLAGGQGESFCPGHAAPVVNGYCFDCGLPRRPAAKA